MSPSIFSFRGLRRRSKASFVTERSTDTSSDGSNGGSSAEPALTTGSLTPPSIAHSSDPALNLQLNKDGSAASVVGQLDVAAEEPVQSLGHTLPRLRPPPSPYAGSTNRNRHSVSGMTGLGSPVSSRGGPVLPVSRYAPRLANLQDNTWVRRSPACFEAQALVMNR